MTHGVQQVLVSPRLSHIWCCQAFYTCQSNWYGLLLCCSALIIHHAKHYYIYVFTFLLHSFREGRRMYVLLWVCACHSTGVEDRRQPGESVLPFCCVGPRDWTQARWHAPSPHEPSLEPMHIFVFNLWSLVAEMSSSALPGFCWVVLFSLKSGHQFFLSYMHIDYK